MKLLSLRTDDEILKINLIFLFFRLLEKCFFLLLFMTRKEVYSWMVILIVIHYTHLNLGRLNECLLSTFWRWYCCVKHGFLLKGDEWWHRRMGCLFYLVVQCRSKRLTEPKASVTLFVVHVCIKRQIWNLILDVEFSTFLRRLRPSCD